MDRGRGDLPLLVNRTSRSEFSVLQFTGDLLFVTGGLLLGYWIRFHSGILPFAGGWDPYLYLNQFPWALAAWMVGLYFVRVYQNHPRVITFNKARRILMASALAVMLMITKNYFMRDENIARMMYPLQLLTVTSSIVLGRLFLQRIISRFLVGKSLPRSRVLIVGIGPVAFRLAARMKKHPEYAYELAGFVTVHPEKVGRKIGGAPVLGTVDNLREVLRNNEVHEVFVAQGEVPQTSLVNLFLESEMARLRVHVIPTLGEMVRSDIFYDEFAGVPMYHIFETPLHGANLVLKRAFDIAVSGVGLALTAPLMAIIALAVKRSSPGPVIYKQTRLSLDGSEFEIYKFRTMPTDAEGKKPAWGDVNDTRATKTGRFLRRWNLDELPQLWNVLQGDMSLVGPRPERPYYVEKFKELFPHYLARHKVQSGMSGWAQVHGLRGSTSIAQRLRYDLYYIENWSLWLDVKILLMTFVKLPGRRRPRPLPVPLELPTSSPDAESLLKESSECQTSQPNLSATKQPG